MTISEKNLEVLRAHVELMEKEPRKHKFGILKELAAASEKNVADDDENGKDQETSKLEMNDEDQRLFFGDEFSDTRPPATKAEEEKSENVDKLIDYDREFDDELMKSSNILLPSQLLMDDAFYSASSGGVSQSENFDLLSSLMPQKSDNTLKSAASNEDAMKSNPSKKTGSSEMNKWFSLFSDLDPLSQQLQEKDDANKNLHAA